MSIQNFLHFSQRWVDAVHFVVVRMWVENDCLNLHHCVHGGARFCIDIVTSGPCHPRIWRERMFFCSCFPVWGIVCVHKASHTLCTYRRLLCVVHPHTRTSLTHGSQCSFTLLGARFLQKCAIFFPHYWPFSALYVSVCFSALKN